MRRGRLDNLRRIERLDPAVDHEEIFRLTTRYEFPWDYQQGTSIAFLRDFGVPSISALLHRTGQFERHGQKRYDDTVLIGFEGVVDGLDSERGRAALRKLNRIHGRYDIPDDEYLYVLATTVVGPKRWIDAYGWRPLHPHEVEAMARVTTRFGELMGIKGLPSTYPAYERLLDDYEAEHFAFAESNRAVAEATIAVFTGRYPRPIRPLLRRVTVGLFDDPLREALGLPAQPAWLRAAVARALRARARVLRALAAPRPADRPFVPDSSRTYPFGYTLDTLGPAVAEPADPAEPGDAADSAEPARRAH